MGARQRAGSVHSSSTKSALRRIQPDARPDDVGFLNAFDSNRDVICAVAAKVYVRGGRGSYDLVAANFRKAISIGSPRRRGRRAGAPLVATITCRRSTSWRMSWIPVRADVTCLRRVVRSLVRYDLGFLVRGATARSKRPSRVNAGQGERRVSECGLDSELTAHRRLDSKGKSRGFLRGLYSRSDCCRLAQ